MSKYKVDLTDDDFDRIYDAIAILQEYDLDTSSVSVSMSDILSEEESDE